MLVEWLSYRERDILHRALSIEEARGFTETARRIGALRIHLRTLRSG